MCVYTYIIDKHNILYVYMCIYIHMHTHTTVSANHQVGQLSLPTTLPLPLLFFDTPPATPQVFSGARMPGW